MFPNSWHNTLPVNIGQGRASKSRPQPSTQGSPAHLDRWNQKLIDQNGARSVEIHITRYGYKSTNTWDVKSWAKAVIFLAVGYIGKVLNRYSIISHCHPIRSKRRVFFEYTIWQVRFPSLVPHKGRKLRRHSPRGNTFLEIFTPDVRI